MSLTLLPLDLPGQVYRSPMPFSRFDLAQNLMAEYKANDISVVVILVSKEESMARSGRDLHALYEREGWEVISLPIRDFGAPAIMADLRTAVEQTLEELRAGRSVVVHCYAGLGRTGMFSACLAKKALGLNPVEAVAWVRRWIPDAVEDDSQMAAVRDL